MVTLLCEYLHIPRDSRCWSTKIERWVRDSAYFLTWGMAKLSGVHSCCFLRIFHAFYCNLLYTKLKCCHIFVIKAHTICNKVIILFIFKNIQHNDSILFLAPSDENTFSIITMFSWATLLVHTCMKTTIDVIMPHTNKQ